MSGLDQLALTSWIRNEQLRAEEEGREPCAPKKKTTHKYYAIDKKVTEDEWNRLALVAWTANERLYAKEEHRAFTVPSRKRRFWISGRIMNVGVYFEDVVLPAYENQKKDSQ